MRISDWSSDVCSSDLLAALLAIVGLWMQVFLRHYIAPRLEQQAPAAPAFAAPPSRRAMTATPLKAHEDGHWQAEAQWDVPRSEERRVGKECVRTCRYRRSPYH